MSDEVIRASKFMAYVLRHDPGSVGLTLGDGGWVPVDELVAAAARHGRRLDTAMIDRVLTAPGKKRYETRDGLIRAAQGHSVAVDLGLEPRQPYPRPPVGRPGDRDSRRRTARPAGGAGRRLRRDERRRAQVLPGGQRGLAHPARAAGVLRFPVRVASA